MKLTAMQKSAQGQDCTLRIPGVCNWNPETTVLAHLGSGTGKRRDDNNAVYACSSCHDAIDYRTPVFLSHRKKLQKDLHRYRENYIKAAIQRMKQL